MKKLISLMLALLMLALPALSAAEGDLGVIGGADGPTAIITAAELPEMPGDLALKAVEAGRRVNMTFSFTDVAFPETGVPEIDAMLVDLVKAIGLRFSEQGDEFDGALTISGQDVLTLGVAASGDDAYIKSNLIGGSVVIGAEEVEPLISRLLDMLVLMEAIPQDEADAIKEQLPVLFETYAAEFEAALAAATLTEDELLNLNLTALETAMQPLMDKAEIITECALPRNVDPAAQGVKLTVSNDEMVELTKAILQTLKDNPELMNYLASELGYYTEAEVAQMWTIYQGSGLYGSEDEFRAEWVTFESIIDASLADLADGQKVLDGEFVVAAYVDEQDELVYLTIDAPMFAEAETIYTEVVTETEKKIGTHTDIVRETKTVAEVLGETTNIKATYYRQTVPAGVSHVVNVDVDGEGFFAEALAQGNQVEIKAWPLNAEADAEPVLRVVLEKYASEENADAFCLRGEAWITPDEVDAYYATMDLYYLFNDEAYQLNLTFDGKQEHTPVKTESMSVGGLTLPGMDQYQARNQATTTTLSFAMNVDYVRNGVDYAGGGTFLFDFNGIRIGMAVTAETSDPETTIISGDVVRPAELDDAAFANWFVGVVNGLQNWANNLLMALPESVLYQLMNMGL